MTTTVPLISAKLKSQGVAMAAQLAQKLPAYQIGIRPNLEWAATIDGVHCGGFAYEKVWIRIDVAAVSGRWLACPALWREEVRRAVNEVLEANSAQTP